MGAILQKVIDFLNPIAFILTGYYFCELLFISLSFSVKELLSLNEYTSFIVSGVVIFYWISRYRIDKKKAKEEKRIRDLEIDILERRNNREIMDEEIKEFLDNDTKSRNL